jgi:hypothetical protein
MVDDQSNSGLARPGRIGFMNVGIRARPEELPEATKIKDKE